MSIRQKNNIDNINKNIHTSKDRFQDLVYASKTYSFYQIYTPYTTYSIYYPHDLAMSAEEQNRILKVQIEDLKAENKKLADYAKQQKDVIDRLSFDNEDLTQTNIQLNSLLDKKDKQITVELSDGQQTKVESLELHDTSLQKNCSKSQKPIPHRQYYKRWLKSHQMSKRNKQRDRNDQLL